MNRYVRPISFRPTRLEFAISSRVRGTLHWRHAAYRLPATTPSIERPRIRCLFRPRRAGGAPFPPPLDVDPPPLRALVDHLVVQDEAALLADQLAPLVIERQVAAIALGTPGDFFRLFDLLSGHSILPLR